MNIRFKLLVSVLTVVIGVMLGVTWLSSTTSQTMLERSLQQGAENLLDATITKLETLFQEYQSVPEDVAMAVQVLKPSQEEELKKLLNDALWLHPHIYGAALAFEPRSFAPDREGMAPYYHRSKEGLAFVDLARTDYNYPAQEWYATAIRTGKPFWTKPYLDTGGGDIMMITYAVPFFRESKPWGVATIDVAVPELSSIVGGLKISKTGYAILMSKEGIILSSQLAVSDSKRTIFDIARDLQMPELDALGKLMLAQQKGYRLITNPATGREAWVAFGPIPASGWTLAIAFPREELLSDLFVLHRHIVGIAIAGILLVTLIILILSTRITNPLQHLAAAAVAIAGGDFKAAVPHTKSRDEVGILSRAFAHMQDTLASTLTRLREEKEMFQFAFREMSDGLTILDPHWRILQYNRVAEKLLLLPPKLPFLEHIMIHFESTHQLSDMDKMGNEQHTCRLMRKITNENDSPLYLECMMVPIFDESGFVRERVIHTRDVTAVESEETSKRNFLSLISHKLFTPLTVLQGKLMLLKDGLLGDLSETQRRTIETAASQTGKLRGLIEALVNFGTADTTGLDSSREPIIVHALIEEIVEEEKREKADRNLNISISVTPNAESFTFNRKYLRTIIHELLDNAIKFNESDPATISIECRRENERIAFSVQDNGLGFPPEFQDKIFDKFFQIDRYFTGNIEGVGLGLSHVKLLVDHFHGTIDVVSEPGRGSRFTVRLPFVA